MRRHTVWLLTLALLGHVAAANGQGGHEVNVKANKNKRDFDFYVGDNFVTAYHTSGFAKPIFWPLNAPGGIPLTRNYPPPEGQAKDHPHQKSAWFCHGDVVPEGIELKDKVKGVQGVDFWSESKGHGKIVDVQNLRPFMRENGNFLSLDFKNEWQTANGTKIMDEARCIQLYVPKGKPIDGHKWYMIIVDIDLHASVCPITFNDTKEGAFGVRINDVINAAKGKGKIQNADGKIGEKECWGQKSAWCDYSGPIDGKLVGLAIFDDPKNPYPACWHVRGYGLMAANPFGREKHAQFPAMKGNNELVRLKKGEHLKLRYGMLLHTGDAISGDVAAAYKRFVELRGKE